MAEYIKTRLKYFFLSFFSDKTAKEAPKFGFLWVILALFLSFLFLLFGYFGAGIAPFASHYDNAGQYTEFIDNAFTTGDVTFRIENKTAQSEKIINTYLSEEDANSYVRHGYNLIVDTRRSDMPIEFTQTAKKGEDEISYEEYRALSDDEKKDYTLVTRYTDTELVITREDIEKYEQFLSSDESSQKDFEALDKDAETYGDRLYDLYVKYYYTSVGSILHGSTVPVLRDYYYRTYITNGNAYYFYVFDDMCAGSFKTDGGIPAVFGGYYDKCSDGEITDIHGFVKKIYYDTASQTFTSYFLGMISHLPALVFLPIIFGLLMWGIGKLVKNGRTNTFGGCYKTVNSFVWVSALLASLAVLIGGWLTTARVMYMLIPILFGGILLVRTAVFCIVTAVKNRKALAKVEQEKNDDIFGGVI